MKLISTDMATPVYLKTEENEPWPEDKMFYLLSSNGLFLCRNHMWFRSCSPAPEGRGPSDLAEQKAELSLSYPVLPRALVEKAVAFFREVFNKHHWESALILVFNKQTQEIELLCPDQEVSFGSVNYEIPTLPHHLVLIGDFHSHCDFSPEPSMTDENDELNRPGLHLIAGYLQDPKPRFHCIVVADGTRFKVLDHDKVMERFESSKGIEVPEEWLSKVKKKEYSSSFSDYSGYSGGAYSSGSWFGNKPSKQDKEIILEVIEDFLTYQECPSFELVRQKLWSQTKRCKYSYCEKRARDFIKHWPKLKAKYDQCHPAQQTAVA